MIMIDLFQETKLITIIETNNDRKSNPSLKNNEITTGEVTRKIVRIQSSLIKNLKNSIKIKKKRIFVK